MGGEIRDQKSEIRDQKTDRHYCLKVLKKRHCTIKRIFSFWRRYTPDEMRRSLLPIVLVTTITLSSSNVLPILSINKLDTEPLLDDQDNDNTFNNKYTNANPNIFYKVFIETPKDNTLKKSQISRSNYMENDSQDAKILNGKIDNEDNDDEGYRKEQWHNYPRQLDRLNRDFNVLKEFDKILLDKKDLEKLKRNDDTENDINQYVNDDVGSFDTDINGPLLILKIRLAYLNDDINEADTNKFTYSDLIPLESKTDNAKDNVREEENVFNANDLDSLIKVKRKGKPRIQDITFLENPTNDKKTVRKRIFSLWSRLQSLSHRGHELHHRRHLYALYGLPEDGGGGGTLTAETRGTMMRPPGSPLRWG
ncbi:jg8073 [Pararge aegeria aegeria]|uniref:Jg8073 protein n=1 Tax=Pararge aegeria aegeria TaxID=348720 RepID=A0A8S4S9C3_9NEOP|nr:jg8073 [Pararge aegeria aegeria]